MQASLIVFAGLQMQQGLFLAGAALDGGKLAFPS